MNEAEKEGYFQNKSPEEFYEKKVSLKVSLK